MRATFRVPGFRDSGDRWRIVVWSALGVGVRGEMDSGGSEGERRKGGRKDGGMGGREEEREEGAGEER